MLRCVAWNPSGSLLASCGGDNTIKIWAQRTNENEELEWKCLDTLRDGHTRTIRWISWSPCGNKIGKLENTGIFIETHNSLNVSSIQKQVLVLTLQ